MRHVLFAVALLALSIASFVAQRSPGVAAPPLQIHAIMSLTGPGAFIGKEEASAFPIVAQTVNKSGGIGGRLVEFVVHDDQSSPQISVQIANDLIASKVPVILGSSLVANCNAIAPLIKTSTVMYCMTPGFHPDKRSYAFSTGVSTTDQFPFWLQYLHRRGLTKIALIASSDANGQDAERGLQAALALPENRDESLVIVEHFSPSDISVNAQIERIKSSGAQVLITYNNGAPFGTILHGMHDAGLDIPVLDSPAVLNYTTMKQLADYIPKELLVFGVPSDAPDVVPPGRMKSTIAAYFDAAKAGGVAPDHTVASVWDPAMIVLSALRKFGPDATAQQIWGYIEGLHGWAGANGEYDFTDGSNRGLSARQGVVVRWDAAKGAFVPMSRLGGVPLGAR